MSVSEISTTATGTLPSAGSRAGASEFEGPFPVISNTWKFDGPSARWSIAGRSRRYASCPLDGRRQLGTAEASSRLGENDRDEVRTQGTPSCAQGSQGNARILADSAGGLHAVWEESIGTELYLLPAPAIISTLAPM